MKEISSHCSSVRGRWRWGRDWGWKSCAPYDPVWGWIPKSRDFPIQQTAAPSLTAVLQLPCACGVSLSTRLQHVCSLHNNSFHEQSMYNESLSLRTRLHPPPPYIVSCLFLARQRGIFPLYRTCLCSLQTQERAHGPHHNSPSLCYTRPIRTACVYLSNYK